MSTVLSAVLLRQRFRFKILGDMISSVISRQRGKLTFAHDTFVAVFCWLHEHGYVLALALGIALPAPWSSGIGETAIELRKRVRSVGGLQCFGDVAAGATLPLPASRERSTDRNEGG
jgi:hypothetical protein